MGDREPCICLQLSVALYLLRVDAVFFFFFSPIGKIERDMGCDCMSIIPALEAMRLADLELRISLVYTVRTRENPKVNETREETVRVHSRKQPAL